MSLMTDARTWLETLSGECMARSSTRCASVLDRICTGLNR